MGGGGCIFNGCLIPESLVIPAEGGLKVPLNVIGSFHLLLGRDVLPRGLLQNTGPQAGVLEDSFGRSEDAGPAYLWVSVVAAVPDVPAAL